MNKIVWTLLTVWSAALGAFATDHDSRKRDSVIVNFGDKTKIVIYAERKEDFQKLLKYDLNALLRDIGAKIDTVSKKGETRISIEEDARRYQKDSIRGKDDNYVRIGIKGIHIKDGADEVHISTSGIRVKDGKDVVNIGVDVEVDSTNNGRKSTSNKNSWRLKSSDFALSLGLNNYLGANGQSAGNQSSEYDLRPFGSRYFSMAFNRRLTIAKGKNAALRLKSGVEFSWYNFMFEGNNVAVKGTQRIEFPESTQALSKSKLTVPYINIPMMPYVSFRQGAITHIGPSKPTEAKKTTSGVITTSTTFGTDWWLKLVFAKPPISFFSMISTASLLIIEAHSSTPLVLVSGYDRILHREYVI
jgi:hypothetical protein